MSLPENPSSRNEEYLNHIATGEGELPEYPVSRVEQYLNYIATGGGETPDYPISRNEQYLAYIAEHGGGGGDITTQPLSVTENGTYRAPSGKAYTPVTVNVPQEEPVLDTLSVTENGTYTPEAGTDGFDEVVVNVPQAQLEEKNVSVVENGNSVINPAPGKDGISKVNLAVNVPQGVPIEVNTDSGMDAVLNMENVGKAYMFTGTTGTYTRGDVYVVEESA